MIVFPQPTIPDRAGRAHQIGCDRARQRVGSQAARGPRLGRAGKGHQRSSGAKRACGPLGMSPPRTSKTRYPADLGVVTDVDELLRAEVKRRLTAGSAPGADDVAGSTCE